MLEQTKQAFLELQGRMIETTSKFKQVIWIFFLPPRAWLNLL